MRFEKEIVGSIPLHEAARFFLKLKTASNEAGAPMVGPQGASPSEATANGAQSTSYAPPDETGALEGQFAVPVEQVLKQMAEMVVNEFKTMYAYRVYSQSMRDLSNFSIADEFEEHSEDELEHAEFLLRRMAVLGGPIDVGDIPSPPASSDPVQIIQTMVRMEQEGLARWKQLHAMMGENPSRFKIEEYMTKEQEHLDQLWQLLPSTANTPVLQGVGALAPAVPQDANPSVNNADVSEMSPPAATEKKAAVIERFHPDTLRYHGDAMRTALMHGNLRGNTILANIGLDGEKIASVTRVQKQRVEGSFDNYGELSARLAEFAKTAAEGPGEGIGQTAAAAAGGYAGHRIAKELLGGSGAGTVKERFLRSLARGGAALAGAGAAGAVGKEVGKSLDHARSPKMQKEYKKAYEKAAGIGGSVDWRPMAPMPMTAGDPMAQMQQNQPLQVTMPVIGDYPGKRQPAADVVAPRRARGGGGGGGGDDMGIGGLDFGKEGSIRIGDALPAAIGGLYGASSSPDGTKKRLRRSALGALGGHVGGELGGYVGSGFGYPGYSVGAALGGLAGGALVSHLGSRFAEAYEDAKSKEGSSKTEDDGKKGKLFHIAGVPVFISTDKTVVERVRRAIQDEKNKTANEHEKGKQRAETNIAARAHQTKGMRGELFGDVIGRLLGGSGGFYAGKAGGSLPAMAGAALGQHVGSRAGKVLGRELDTRRHFAKHAFDDTTNFLSQEQALEEAQVANEARFYQEQAQQAQAAKAQMEQALQQAQAQTEQQKAQLEQLHMTVEQQSQMANDATTKALMQSVEANNAALQSRQVANDTSNAFMQFKQKLREMVDGSVEAPSADGPSNPQGPANQAASPGSPQIAAPPEGEQTTPAPQQSPANGSMGSDAAPSSNISQREQPKTAGALDTAAHLAKQVAPKVPYALAGAGFMGGLQHMSNQMGSDDLRNDIEEQEAKGPTGSFADALRLAQRKARLALAEAGEAHPVASTAAAALGGASLGATLGPGLAGKLVRAPKDIKTVLGG